MPCEQRGVDGLAGGVCQCTSLCVITISFHFPLQVVLSGAKQDITLWPRSTGSQHTIKEMKYKKKDKGKQNGCLLTPAFLLWLTKTGMFLCPLIPSAPGMQIMAPCCSCLDEVQDLNKENLQILDADMQTATWTFRLPLCLWVFILRQKHKTHRL